MTLTFIRAYCVHIPVRAHTHHMTCHVHCCEAASCMHTCITHIHIMYVVHA